MSIGYYNQMPEESRPVPFVDTAGLSRSEWLEYRKHGIGASDLPILMEVSEYKSVLALYQEKHSRKPLSELQETVRIRVETDKTRIHVKTSLTDGHYGDPVIDPDCGSEFNLAAEVGNALEPVIAKYLSCRFGLPVYKDTMMYRHPEYPFLLVDLDYMMIAPDRKTCELNRLVIIECKTASWWKKDDWEDGVPYAYELQCRHAMCVMNVDEVFIICLFDNNEGGVAVYSITRDYNIEAQIIQCAKSFWEGHVEKGVLPNPTIPTKAAKRELAEYACRQEKYKPRPQLFERGLSDLVNEYEDLSFIQDVKKQEYEDAKEKLEAVKMKLSTFMFNYDEAVCGDLKLRWKVNNSRSVDHDGLRLAYPLIYAKFVKENHNLGFEVKAKKSSKQKEAA